MKKSIKVYYYVDGFVEVREFEYKEDFTNFVEDGLIYIKSGDKTRLVINKEYFISLERIEE